ncbi:hypothetical protein PRJ_1642 [Pseudomonas sp. XWY-1]|nr:hypothetical protein PRJ_1642 [Pseudomonas sp. XWY-1]
MDSWIQPVVGAGSPAKRPAPAGQSPPAVHRCCRHRIRG